MPEPTSPEAGEPRIDDDRSVTTIITHRPLKNEVAAYESWLREIVPIAQTFAGHRGVNIIRPHPQSEDYTIVLHFDNNASLRSWLDSDTRKSLISKVLPLLNAEEKINIQAGIEYWFTPQGMRKAAPAYKQFIVTLSAIFPLTVLVPWLLSPVFAWMPVLEVPGLRQFIVAVFIVGFMTFWLMPRYVRLISKWLYR